MHQFIREFPSIISPELCTQLIAKFDHYETNPTQRIRVVDKFLTDGGSPGDVRSKEAQVIYLDPDVLQAEDPEFLGMIQQCHQNIAHCVDEYIRSFEIIKPAPIQVDQVDFMKYPRGEGFYGRHIDAGSRALQHRVLSFVLYLNDVGEGGETDFPLQGKQIAPQAGKLAIFPSAFCFVHGSTMAVSDPKYVLVAFSSYAM